MSSTIRAPYKELGIGGDYPVEMNYGVRIYDNDGEIIPEIGEIGYSVKGGLRTNYFGIVPILDGTKKVVGKVEILEIVSLKLDMITSTELEKYGFESKETLLSYIHKYHKDEFERDGVITIFKYKVIS